MSSEFGAGSLEGRTFRVAVMGAEGEASEATVFEYHERDGVIWARYEGGAVRLGFLVGTRQGDRLEFRYSQLNESGETSSGRCSTTISTLTDGRLRLDEDWEWGPNQAPARARSKKSSEADERPGRFARIGGGHHGLGPSGGCVRPASLRLGHPPRSSLLELSLTPATLATNQRIRSARE